MFASNAIRSILSPKPVFLKLLVGMHMRPPSVYEYSGAITRIKRASAPLAKLPIKFIPKMQAFKHVFELTCK